MSAGDARPPRSTPNRLADEEKEPFDLKGLEESVKGKVRVGHGVPRSPEERLKAGVPYSESLIIPVRMELMSRVQVRYIFAVRSGY
jgi:hypothetical protein